MYLPLEIQRIRKLSNTLLIFEKQPSS